MTLSTKDIQTLQVIMAKADESDWKMINHVMRQAHTMMQSRAANVLHMGCKVEFDGRGGKIVRGRVTKINQKSVRVVTDEGVSWKVSPSLLRKVA